MQRSIIAPAERVTNLRWAMVAVVAALVLAVSVDGVALVLGGWTDLDRIAFVAGMVVAQLPAGLLLDRYGVRLTGTLATTLWILASLLALLGGATLLVASIGIGVATAFFLPLAMKATASWFPRNERSTATAIVVAAASAPIVLTLSPLVPKLPAGTTPIASIVLTAVVGTVFALTYRDANDDRVTYAERTYIVDGGAQPVAVPAFGPTFATLVRSRTVWAAAFGFGAFSYAFGLGAVQVWGVGWSPAALVLMVLVGGMLIDGASRAGARWGASAFLVTFSLLASAWPGVWRFSGTGSIVFASLVLIGYAVALPIAWSIPGRIAPSGAVGSVAAIVALAGTIGAGWVWWSADDPSGASLAGVIAALIYAFALGRIEPIPDPV